MIIYDYINNLFSLFQTSLIFKKNNAKNYSLFVVIIM